MYMFVSRQILGKEVLYQLGNKYMETKNYTQMKTVGNVEVVKAGGGYAVISKRWDSKTGLPTTSEKESINPTVLAERKAELLAEIAGIDAVLSDINKLVVPK